MSMRVKLETCELQDESFLCSTQQGQLVGYCKKDFHYHSIPFYSLVFSLCTTAAVRQAVSCTKVSVDRSLLAPQHLAANQHGRVR